MTAKDVQQANAELRRLIIEGGMEGMPARVIRAAMQDHATKLRAALLPFDSSALAVVGWQYKSLPITKYSEWSYCKHMFYEIAKSRPANYIVREIYAAPEAT